MLEGVLASVIERIAGKYVDGIDRKAANMSVWSGHIVLKDLAIKPSALDDMELPVKVQYGRLEELSLDIPWKNLRAKPVIVRVSGLYLIVGPNTDAGLSAEETAQREQEAKRAAIEEMNSSDPDLLESMSAEAGAEGGAEGESFTTRLVNKIVANIQLKVSNIHIRYEDCFTDKERPFALGMMLKSFTAESTNDRWVPSFVEHQRLLHKMVLLEGLSLYLDSDGYPPAPSCPFLLGHGYEHKMSDMVAGMATETLSSMDKRDLQQDADLIDEGPAFVVKPIDGRMKLIVNQSTTPSTTHPRYDATVEMTRVALRLQKRQYRDIVRTLDFLSNHERIVRYAKFRPAERVLDNPKAWWLFAYQCVVWEREQRMRRFDKNKLMRVLAIWPKYALLYRRRFAGTIQGVNPLEASDGEKMAELEEALPLEAIRAAREIVQRELREAVKRQVQEGIGRKSQEKERIGLFRRMYGWIGGGSPKPDGQQQERVSAAAAKSRLLAEMGMLDESEHGSRDGDEREDGGLGGGSRRSMGEGVDEDPEQAVRMRVAFVLMRGSVTLVTNESGGEETPIAMVNYKQLSLQVLTKANNSMAVSLSLASFVVTDLFSRDLAPGFHRIISRYDPADQTPTKSKEGTRSAGLGLFGAKGSVTGGMAGGWGMFKAVAHTASAVRASSPSRQSVGTDEQPLLWLVYETNPADSIADSRLVVRLDRMTIVYSTGWMRALTGFLDVAAESPALEMMKRAAAEQLEEARKLSQKNLEVALKEKLVFDLCLDLRSPLILVPHSTERHEADTDVLVLQPGNFTLWSMREHVKETSPLLQKMVREDEGFDGRLYNTLMMELSDVSVLVCDRQSCWKAQGGGAESVVSDIRVSICVDNSIVPESSQVTRTRVKVALPRLNVDVSRHKYQAILKVLSAISSSDEDPPPTPPQEVRRRASSQLLLSEVAEVSRSTSTSQEESAKAEKGDPLWKTLDVLVLVAPTDAVSLTLSKDSGIGTPLFKRGDEIAIFSLRSLQATYVTYGDGRGAAEVSIGSVHVQDVRPRVSNSFRGLVAPSGQTPKLLTVQMLSFPDAATEYVASIGHIDFFCVPSALAPILGVFESPPASSAPQTPVLAPQGSELRRAGTSSGVKVRGDEIEEVATTASRRLSARRASSSGRGRRTRGNSEGSGSCARKKTMVAHLFLISPSITLIEDCTDINTKRVSLRLSAMCKHMSYSDGSSRGKAHVQDLQVNVQGQQWAPTTSIVEPFSISCDYAFDSHGGSDLSLVASDIDVWVAYSDIKLITAISQTFSAFSGEGDAKTTTASSPSKTPSKTPAKTPPKTSPRTGARTTSPGGSFELRTVDEDEVDTKMTRQDWRFDCGTMLVTLINDCAGFNEPFCSLTFEELRCVRTQAVEGECAQALRCHLACGLFNAAVMEFEPILEDWSFSFEATSQAAVGVDGHSHSGLRMMADEVLNMNVTEGQISNLISTLEMWQADWGGADVSTGLKRRGGSGGLYASYAVRNRCGEELRVRNLWRDGEEGGTAPLVVTPGGSSPFFFHDKLLKRHSSEMIQRMRRSRKDRSRVLHVNVGEGADSDDEGFPVPVNAAEVRVFRTRGGGRVIAEVSEGEVSGSRVLTLSSGVSVSNECSQGVEACVISEEGETLVTLKLVAGETIDLSPDLCISNQVSIAFRPLPSSDATSGPGFSWSDTLSLKTDRAAKSDGIDLVVNCPSEGGASTWYARAVSRVTVATAVDGEPADAVSLAVMPVLVISNLLPCAMDFCFFLEGDARPMCKRMKAQSGEDVSIHSIDLERKVSLGVELPGLDGGSEFVPIFCPDGSPPETFLSLFDEARDMMRLNLLHRQENLEAFSVSVSSMYWFDNRTGYPLTYGQKWTASNVTLRGGQSDDGGGFSIKCGMPDPSTLERILSGSDMAPLPYSFHTKVDLGGAKACVRLGKPFEKYNAREGNMGPCEWSQPFSLDTVGGTQAVDIAGEGFLLEAAMQVSLAPGRFCRTKIITLTPRCVICNKVDQPVSIGQVGCEDSYRSVIGPGEMQVVRWLDESKERALRIKLLPDQSRGQQEWGWQWSDALSRNAVGYFPLKLRAKKLRPDGSPRVYNLAVHVTSQGPTTFIVIRQQDPECPAIQVHNTSSWASVAYRQLGVDGDLEERALPGVPTGYCWDRPQGPNVLSVRAVPRDLGVGVGEIDCNMDRLGALPMLKVGERYLRIKIEARGPTKVLSIEDDGNDEDEYVKMGSGGLDTSDVTTNGGTGGASWHLSLSLVGFGLSVIDATPKELLYLSVSNVSLDMVQSTDWALTDLYIQRIQIDNQTSLGQPVLLGLSSVYHPSSAPEPLALASPSNYDENRPPNASPMGSARFAVPSESGDSRDSAYNDWFCVVRIAKSLKNTSVDSFQRVDVSLKDLSLDIDERLLVRLLSATRGVISVLAPPPESNPDRDSIMSAGAIDLSSVTSDRDDASLRWTYIEHLHVSPVRIFISYRGSDDAHGLLDDLMISKLPIFAFVEAAKAMVTNIDRAPILLSKIDWEQPFLPRDELIGRVSKHYRNSILGGLYRLVGALEFLGNPTGLVTNISSGMQEFVEYSREGIKDGRLGKGLAMGTGRLVGGTVQGVFGSAAGLSGAMGKGLAQLTFDGDYKRARSLLDQNKPVHLGQGVWQGGREFGRGIYQGVTGVVTQPIKGYSRAGARGAIKGFGKGLVGVVVKPMAGMVDMVSQTSQGIRNTPEYMSRKGVAMCRVRLPRLWERGTAVRGYDRRRALGSAMLAKVGIRMGWTADDVGGLVDYLCWNDTEGGAYVIFITTTRIILCQRFRIVLTAPGTNLRILSDLPIGEIASIKEQADTVVLNTCQEDSQSACLGGICFSKSRLQKRQCTLHVVDANMREWLVQKLRSTTRTDETALAGEDWQVVEVDDAEEGEETEARRAERVYYEGAQQNAGEMLRQVTVEIERSEVRGTHAVYAITCRVPMPDGGEQRWTVYRRYREFDRLRRDILRSITKQRSSGGPAPNLRGRIEEQNVPALPRKRLFGSASTTTMRERASAFNVWLRGMQQQALLDQACTRLVGKFIANPRPLSAANRWAGGDSGSPLPGSEQVVQGRQRTNRRISQ